MGERHLIKNTEFPAFKAFIEIKDQQPNLKSVIFLDECSASKRSEIIIELCRYMKEN